MTIARSLRRIINGREIIGLATDDEILTAIEERAAEANDAILAIQAEHDPILSLDMLRAIADSLGEDVPGYILYDFLGPRNLRLTFESALEARGLRFTSTPQAPVGFDYDEGQRFIGQAQAFRCKIVGGTGPDSEGSGCLVGPHLVMTAAHVIRVSGDPAALHLPLTVFLSDGTSRKVVGDPVYLSNCASADNEAKWPADDTPFDGFHDVALLRLETAEGARFGYPPLPPTTAAPGRARRDMMLVHYPEGEDTNALTLGKTRAIRGVKARVGHDAAAAPGSSGGPCFGLDCQLIGLHQGRWETRRRLVPVELFADEIRQIISNDVAPQTVWSLTETPGGRLIFGRDELFGAMAGASQQGARAQGVRILRAAPESADGMALCRQIVERLVQLRPDRILLYVPASVLGMDPFGSLRAEARASGFEVPESVPGAGVDDGDTTPEATMRERAINLMTALNAATGGAQLWIYLEQDVELIDPTRIGLEMLIEAAFSQPNLKLVLAGFETLSTPGESFETPGLALGAGAPGLIEAPLREFSAADVRICLERARRGLGMPERSPAQIDAIVKDVLLAHLPSFNGRYALPLYRQVETRLHNILWPTLQEDAA